MQGYKKRARLIGFLVAVRAEVSKISDLQLDTVECQAKNDFEDVCNGVIGFAGDVMSQHKHASEIECIVTAGVAESPSFMLQSVGRALKAADGWKERVAELFANKEVMGNLLGTNVVTRVKLPLRDKLCALGACLAPRATEGLEALILSIGGINLRENGQITTQQKTVCSDVTSQYS